MSTKISKNVNKFLIFQLNAYIDDLASQNDFMSVVSIGKSLEGRDMRVLQITKAGPGKPNVWIEAGIHAREWIAPAMVFGYFFVL